MTRIQIFRTRDGRYRSFSCQGHTGYSEAGTDIVCAGVSAIVINTVNCLSDLLQENMEVEYDEDDGVIICNFYSDLSEKGAFLIDCMIHGLEWIQQQSGEEYLDYQIIEL